MDERAQMAAQVGPLVRRSRAGDENAMAQITLIGQRARKGDKRAMYSAKMIEAYAKAHPPEETNILQIGQDMPTPMVMDSPAGDSRVTVIAGESDASDAAPPLPRGALDGVCDPDHFVDRIAQAGSYKNGIDAVAVVLAAKRPLTRDMIEDIAENDLDEKEGQIFLFGVARCTPEDWAKTAPSLNEKGRKYLTLGQCFGRARRLQAIRHPRVRLSSLDPVVGWELGE